MMIEIYWLLVLLKKIKKHVFLESPSPPPPPIITHKSTSNIISTEILFFKNTFRTLVKKWFFSFETAHLNSNGILIFTFSDCLLEA